MKILVSIIASLLVLWALYELYRCVRRHIEHWLYRRTLKEWKVMDERDWMTRDRKEYREVRRS